MNGDHHDQMIVQKIIRSCDEAAENVAECGNSKEIFLANRNGCYATAMCLMQIGELAGQLSNEAKARMSIISWDTIRSMGSILANGYANVDWNATWVTAAKDLPILWLVCHRYLEN